MGKIHDRFKKQATILQARVTVTDARIRPAIERLRKEDGPTINAMNHLIWELDRVRGDRTLDTGDRHFTMQMLAKKAKDLGLKGRWNLLCNRTQCLRTPATWYNRGSYAFYCADCARELNRLNARDAEYLLGPGEPLCIEVAIGAQAETLHVMP